jgi:hypothetical protein
MDEIVPDRIPDPLDAYKQQLDIAKAKIESLQAEVGSLKQDLEELFSFVRLFTQAQVAEARDIHVETEMHAIMEKLAAKYPKVEDSLFLHNVCRDFEHFCDLLFLSSSFMKVADQFFKITSTAP